MTDDLYDLTGYAEDAPDPVAPMLPILIAAAKTKKAAAHAASSVPAVSDATRRTAPHQADYDKLISGYDGGITGYLAELDKLKGDPDYTQLKQQAKARGAQSLDLMRASILAGLGPQDLQPMARTLAQESMSMRSPMKVEGGHIDVEGNLLLDPGYGRQRTIAGLRDDITALEKLKGSAIASRERADVQRERDRDRDERQRETAQALREYRNASLDVRRAGAAGAAEGRADRAESRRSGERFRQSQTLSREYDGRVKSFSEGLNAAQNLIQLAASPDAVRNPQTQTAMVFAFGRMLDPTSVVREGEYRLFEQGRGWLEAIGATPERIASGARLTPDQIRRMMTTAQQLVTDSAGRKQALQDYYGEKARRWQLDPLDVMPDFAPRASATAGAPGAAPHGSAADRVLDYKTRARQ